VPKTCDFVASISRQDENAASLLAFYYPELFAPWEKIADSDAGQKYPSQGDSSLQIDRVPRLPRFFYTLEITLATPSNPW
jgi:hypothetical protein